MAEVAQNDLNLMVYGSYEIPNNVNLGSLPKKYAYCSLEVCINQFMKELIDFDWHYKIGDAAAVHEGFRPMDHN